MNLVLASSYWSSCQVVKFEEASGGRFSVSVDLSDINSKKLPLRKL